MMSSSGVSEVQNFYRDCVLFITGGSGFLGKLAIEKILRSCPGVKRVYVLARAKKGVSVEQRAKALLDNAVFDRMKFEQPDSIEKIVFVSGDCSAPRLGLSDSDYHDLTQQVNIVLHLAATVRFDESFNTAVNINVKGTQEIISLCHNCVSLKAAVIVSTAYSNCHVSTVKEEVYDPPYTLEGISVLMAEFTGHELDILFEKIKGPWPNTYIFSKAIAENFAMTHGKDLPIVVVRPSIVLSTLKEPMVGWVDNIYGPISIALAVACGILRVSYTNAEAFLDVVPADLVTNCIIASALTVRIRSQDAIPVYNITMSGSNPLTIQTYTDVLFAMRENTPLNSSIWYPYVFFVKSYKVYMLLSFFLHLLPGCLLDLVLRLKGKPQILLKIYRKIQKHVFLTNYFTRQNWTFVSENTKRLYEHLSPQDKELFAFDTSVLDWERDLTASALHARVHLLNESLDDIDEARSRNKKFFIAHTLMVIILLGAVLFICCQFLRTNITFYTK